MINKKTVRFPQKRTQSLTAMFIPYDLPSIEDIQAELYKSIPGLKEYLPSSNFVILIYTLETLRGLSENYLFKIMQTYNNQNKNVIFIIDIFWYYQREIIINIIKHRTGLNSNNNKKIGARQVEIREISASTAKEFLVKYHAHGARSSSIKLGIYYKDNLVSVMTFGKPLLSYNTHKVELEFHRHCVKPDITIVGLLDKVLAYLLSTYGVHTILHYKENLYYNDYTANQKKNYIGEIGVTNYYIINNFLYPRLQAMNLHNLQFPPVCYDKISTPGSSIYIMNTSKSEDMFK